MLRLLFHCGENIGATSGVTEKIISEFKSLENQITQNLVIPVK